MVVSRSRLVLCLLIASIAEAFVTAVPFVPHHRFVKLRGGSTRGLSSDNEIVVESSIELPFPAAVAYDAFSDLRRQPTWSPWLSSVEYIDDGTVTKWTMRYLGLTVSWLSESTLEDRPSRIEWRSVEGLRNAGCVDFECFGSWCSMRLKMTFVAPWLAVKLFRNSEALKRAMENRILAKTLENFKQVVLENDLAI